MVNNSSELSKLIELVKLDKELYQLLSERAALISHLENIEIEIENLQKDIEIIYKKLKDFKRSASILESDLRVIDEQEIEKNKQINQASTTRQYYSLEHEIEEIKKQRDELENKLFSLLNQIQELEITYHDAVSNAKEKKENLTKDTQSFEKRLYDLDKQVNLAASDREGFELKLQQAIPETLEQYNLIKAAVLNPAVRLNVNSCSACFYQLTLNELSKIKEQKLIRCQDCHRFIYL